MATITSYASGTDFLARYDARLIGDLVRDDGTQEPSSSLPINLNLLAALSDAYGLIISTITVGDRYTLDQLDPTKLSPAGLSYLIRLNCDLALLYIKRRRGKFNEKSDGQLLKDTNSALEGLKNGASILLGILDANAQASVISMAQPELIPICQRNSIRFNTRNYYPVNYPQNGKARQYTGNGN